MTNNEIMLLEALEGLLERIVLVDGAPTLVDNKETRDAVKQASATIYKMWE